MEEERAREQGGTEKKATRMLWRWDGWPKCVEVKTTALEKVSEV